MTGKNEPDFGATFEISFTVKCWVFGTIVEACSANYSCYWTMQHCKYFQSSYKMQKSPCTKHKKFLEGLVELAVRIGK